eukprot:scaffold1135_cov343-Prasinococcus_capsulatus_cf.AAC.23
MCRSYSHVSDTTKRHVAERMLQEERLNAERIAQAKREFRGCDSLQRKEEHLFGIDEWSAEENHAFLTARYKPALFQCLAALRARWVRLVRECDSRCVERASAAEKGRGLEGLLEVMKGLLPGRSRGDVVRKWSWHNRKQAARHRWEDAIATSQRERSCVRIECEKLLEEEASQLGAKVRQHLSLTAAQRRKAPLNEMIAQAKQDHDLKMQKMKQTELHEKLERLRPQKEARDFETQQRRLEEISAEKQKREEKQRSARRAQTVRREKVAEYNKAKLEKASEEARSRKLLKEKACLEARKAATINSARVEYRQEQRRAMERTKREMEETEEMRRIEAEKRLAAIRAQVRVVVAPDPRRAMQHTASSAATKPMPTDAEQHLRTMRMHGFTHNQIVDDGRFRLTNALREQNLHRTPAGRKAILDFVGDKPTRIDNLTSVQRGLA